MIDEPIPPSNRATLDMTDKPDSRDVLGCLPPTLRSRTAFQAVRSWRIWPIVIHSLRTAIAAVASLLVARLFQLPATFWAPITTLVITQSSLGAAWKASTQRFIGTLFGAILGAFLVERLGSSAFLFGSCIFLLGLICAGSNVDRTGYRFGGITLTIVMLIPRTDSAWHVAFQRFSEVSVGIAVALLLAKLWPEKDIAPLPLLIETGTAQERKIHVL